MLLVTWLFIDKISYKSYPTVPDWRPEFTEVSIKTILMPKAEELGKGSVLWPLRVALSGKDKSPDPFTLLAILGKEESLKRIEKASNLL